MHKIKTRLIQGLRTLFLKLKISSNSNGNKLHMKDLKSQTNTTVKIK